MAIAKHCDAEDTGDWDAALPAALLSVRAAIDAAALRAGRAPADVTLIAVSKTAPASAVLSAWNAGQAVFGENRVQEAQGKFPPLRPGRPSLRLHLIGGLQTNKVADAVNLADVVETVDRPRLVDAIARAADGAGRCPDLLVQVNVGDEPQKSGVARADADALIRDCRARLGDRLTGLMCVPPADADPAPHFAWLAACAGHHGLRLLSMGMSADFEVAIAHGATHVRVGSAIFGARPPVAPRLRPGSS